MPFVSPYDKPTRLEALRYYRRVSDAFALDVVFDETVVAIGREDGVPDDRGSFIGRHTLERGVRRSLRGRSVVMTTGAYDIPNPPRCARRRFTARLALLHATTSVLPQERRDRRWQELGRRGRAGPVSCRRARDDRASAGRAWRVDQVLGQAGHREPDQGRLNRGPVQRADRRDPADERPR